MDPASEAVPSIGNRRQLPLRLGQPGARGSREEILEAVAFASEQLLRTASWQDCIDGVLLRLGEAAAVSRVYVFENARRDDGVVVSSLVHEWVVPGVEGTGHHPWNQGAPYADGFERWEAVLGNGHAVFGNIADFPETERVTLAVEQIAAIAVVPIFADARWWGYLGFDDCEGSRNWTLADIDALKAAAGILGAAIERQTFDREHREMEVRYRTLVEHIPAVTYIDAYPDEQPGTPIPMYISPQVEAVLGYSPAEWMSDRKLWEKLLHPEDSERVRAEAWQTTREGVPYSTEYRMMHRDGHVVWVWEEASIRRDEARRRDIWQGVWYDITARKQAEEQAVEAEAKHRALVEQIPAIVYLAEFGGEGDWLYVSPQIEQMLGYTPKEWMAHSEPPFRLGGTDVYVSASLGISVYPFHAEDAKSLLKNAETAMYQSKRARVAGHVVYSQETADALSRLSLATRLRKAIEQQNWTLHYQPLVELATGAITGVEALTRWSDPDSGLIGPVEFIPLAEEMGLIRDIGDWVIEELSRQAGAWSELRIPLEVSFNVSPQELWHPEFIEKVLRQLEAADVDPRIIVMEITESAAMTDPDRMHRVSEELQGCGLRLAIDDFGTGYSSLSRLKELPVDILKIDRSFIGDIPGDRHATNMVKAVIQLAGGLDMRPLAEGVETEEQRRFLVEQGCLAGQGFLFSRPVPAEEIEGQLRRTGRAR